MVRNIQFKTDSLLNKKPHIHFLLMEEASRLPIVAEVYFLLRRGPFTGTGNECYSKVKVLPSHSGFSLRAGQVYFLLLLRGDYCATTVCIDEVWGTVAGHARTKA
jgi:hypothetical protein